MRQINLLPESLQKAQYKSLVIRSAMLTFGSTLAFIILIHAGLAVMVGNLESKIQNPPPNIDTIEFAQMRQQIQDKSNNIQKYFSQYGAVIDAYGDNYFSVDIMKVIGTISQHKVWFTRLNLNNKKRTCEIEGKSYNTRLVSEFMLGIKKTPFFENVALISMEKGQDEKVDFKLECSLK